MIKSLYRNISYLKRKFKSTKKSYSYGGCDLLINYIFRNNPKGFYIDIGCNHPIYNNNTYLLFKRGWNGVNIDLDKDCIDLFDTFRKKDLNINCALSSSEGTKDLYFYHNKSPINTLDKKTSERQVSNVNEIKQINTVTLNSVLEKANIYNNIDVVCIDVEGHELDVIKGFDIKKYSPKIIVIEYLDPSISKLEVKNLNIENVLNSDIYKVMKKNGYTLINWLHSDLIFAEKNFRD